MNKMFLDNHNIFFNTVLLNTYYFSMHELNINTSLNNLAKEYDIYGKNYEPKNIDYRHKNELLNNNNLNEQENSFSNSENNSIYFIDNEKSIFGNSTFADINKIFKKQWEKFGEVFRWLITFIYINFN